MNKNTKIGLGIIAALGIGYYLYNRNKKKAEVKSNFKGGDKVTAWNKGKWIGRKNIPLNS
jgi:hypothetical protein